MGVGDVLTKCIDGNIYETENGWEKNKDIKTMGTKEQITQNARSAIYLRKSKDKDIKKITSNTHPLGNGNNASVYTYDSSSD